MDVRKLTWNLATDDNASSAIAGINKETDKLKGNIAGTQKSLKELGKVGSTLTKTVTLPLAGIATAGVRTVAKFDDSMSKVQAISGATQEQFKKLRDQAKDLGATTAHSASDAAQGQEILAAAGLKTNEILDTTPGLLTLMSAGSVDANVAAKALTGTIAQFNLTAKDSNRIVDVFSKGAASANTNVGEMQEAFKMAGGDLANMNMDIEQTAGMVGVLADVNIVGSQAGTTLSAMAREIRGNADSFKKLGINVYDAQGNMRDMGSILSDVEAKTSSMTDAQRDAALSSVFTGQAMRGVNAFLAKGSTGYEELTKSIYDSEGAGLKMAGTMEDNIGGAFRSLKSAGEGFLIEVGDVLKDDVQTLAGQAANLVRGFTELDDGTKKTIIKVAGLAMAIGPLISAFSGLAGFLLGIPAKLAAIKGALTLLTGPVGIAVTVITGLIAVGIHLYRTNEVVREKMDAAWAGIKNTVSKGVGYIAGVWEDAKDIVVGVFDFFVGLPAKMFDIGKNMISSLGKGLKSVGTGIWNSTLGKIPGLKIDGSNAGGANFIGKDGSIRKLHRREMVLTGETADEYRSLGGTKDRLPVAPVSGGGSREVIDFRPIINIEVNSTQDRQIAMDIKKAVESQLEIYFKKLNLQRG